MKLHCFCCLERTSADASLTALARSFAGMAEYHFVSLTFPCLEMSRTKWMPMRHEARVGEQAEQARALAQPPHTAPESRKDDPRFHLLGGPSLSSLARAHLSRVLV